LARRFVFPRFRSLAATFSRSSPRSVKFSDAPRTVFPFYRSTLPLAADRRLTSDKAAFR
jgi:hypothetical protein